MFVDVHTHLYYPKFESDLDEVIARAKSAGMVSIINAGTDHESNVKVLELTKKDEILNATLGIYPTTIEKMSEEELDDELKFIKKNKDKILGIGEIGLDFHLTKDKELQEKQVNFFKKTLTTLKELNKPFVIHSRKAERECIEILEELKIKKVVFHCFSGKLSLIKRIEGNGWLISIPANIDKSEHFQGAVQKTSISNLLTETDAPFLAPKDKDRSEPSFVINTINKIAELKKLDKEEVKKNIFLNYQRTFL